MKKKVIVSFMLGLCSTGLAFADYGNRGAYGLCETMSYSSSKASCFSLVNNHRFQEEPLRICGASNFDSEKMSCLQAIADQSYDHDALDVCSSMSYSGAVRACLTSVSGHSFEPAASKICRSASFDSEKQSCLSAISDQKFDVDGLNLCSSMSYSGAIRSCMTTIANQRIATNASAFCRQLSFDSEKASCGSVILNHSYDDFKLSACSQLPFASQKMTCLSQIARPFDSNPRRDDRDERDGRGSHGGHDMDRGGHGGRPGDVNPDEEGVASCQDTFRDLRNSCDVSQEFVTRLRRMADHCDTAESRNGTKVQLIVKKHSGDVIVMNTRGESSCHAKLLTFGAVNVEAINTIHGQRRSDKVFMRMSTGQLYVMDMGHNVVEVLNARGRSLNVVDINDKGNEAIELVYAAGNHSIVTFEELDDKARQGNMNRVPVAELSLDAIFGRIRW